MILLFGDMRSVEIPEKADILVSELLGSFGDNELSPECLDGAMRFLKRVSLLSYVPFHFIPAHYLYVHSRWNLNTLII